MPEPTTSDDADTVQFALGSPLPGSGNFSDDFKRDAIAQITERGDPFAEVTKTNPLSKRALEDARQTEFISNA